MLGAARGDSPGEQLDGTAAILTLGDFLAPAGKTAHGLVRGTERYRVVGLIDGPATAGRDAGELLDGRRRGIPCFASLADLLATGVARPDWCIVGVANAGGVLPPEMRPALREALEMGIGVVSGLHEFVGDDPALAAAAARAGARILDLRRPKPRAQLHFFTGEVQRVRAPRIAILGTDCALGKRTTGRLLLEALRAEGIAAQLVFTGQTGWMQGYPYGFILDATPNDFVSGELEHALVTCDRETRPDLILISGQSGLRNPSGPCGAEIVISGGARGVILQHAPGRDHYKDVGGARWPLPPLREDLELVRLYGARTLGLALHGAEMTERELRAARDRLAAETGLPVALPLEEGVGALVPVARAFVEAERRG